MSKASPKIQFEMDVSGRFHFVAVHNDTLLVYLKQGDGTSYVVLHCTRNQLEEIANAIKTHFRVEDMEKMKEEELV